MPELFGKDCPPLKPGDVLGPFKVIGFERIGAGRHRLWRCECVTCGSKYVKRRCDFFKNYSSGYSRCKACWLRSNKGRASTGWRGHGELSRLYFGRIARNAAARGIGFDITIEYAWGLFLEQGRRCALTGDRLVMPGQTPGPGEKVASLDRVDSRCYYRPGNVQWTSLRGNLMKGDMSDDEFVSECKKVVKHSKRKK